MLRDLRDTVLPIYQEGYLREFRRGREEPESDQEALVSLNRFRVPVVRAIVNWTIRYRLVNSEDNWTVTHAGLCVQTWAEYRRGRDSLLAPALVDTSAARYARGPTFDFSMPGWDFEFQLWTDFDQEATEHFQKRLKAYRTEVEKLAAEAGYEPELRKRGRSSNDVLMHYEWLALRVCKRLTNEEIGRRYSPPCGRRLTEAAVRDAVKRTAKSIGLPRPNRR